jgi:hypothetical protein
VLQKYKEKLALFEEK